MGIFLKGWASRHGWHGGHKKPQFSSQPTGELWSGILLPGLTLSPVGEVCNFLQGFLYSSDCHHHQEVSSESPRNISASSNDGISGKFCAISLLSIQ